MFHECFVDLFASMNVYVECLCLCCDFEEECSKESNQALLDCINQQSGSDMFQLWQQ